MLPDPSLDIVDAAMNFLILYTLLTLANEVIPEILLAAAVLLTGVVITIWCVLMLVRGPFTSVWFSSNTGMAELAGMA